MAKKEVKTDLWVYDLLRQAGIVLDAQGSSIKEIDDALKTASKRGTGNVGFPEYVGVVKDYLIVIEDKADLSKHIKRDENGNVSLETSAVTDFAVNGAFFYGKHLAKTTSYKKIIGYKWTMERLERSSIMLPADGHGNPDYDCMEQYGKQLMIQCYQRYLGYISERERIAN